MDTDFSSGLVTVLESDMGTLRTDNRTLTFFDRGSQGPSDIRSTRTQTTPDIRTVTFGIHSKRWLSRLLSEETQQEDLPCVLICTCWKQLNYKHDVRKNRCYPHSKTLENTNET